MGTWRTRWEQARRDVDVLRRRLMGERLSPIVHDHFGAPREPVAGNVPSRSLGYRSFRVTRAVRETSDATSLYLRAEDGDAVTFNAGQFLSLEVEVDGDSHRRAYSIAAAEGAPLHVTVKAVEGGRVSPRLVNAQAGEVFRVLGPSGAFGLNGSASGLFVAGGSGITPIISMVETLLRNGGRCALVYANRHARSVIFHERLKALESEHGARLTIMHRFDDRDGPLNGPALASLIAGVDDETPAYLCGPAGMMDALRSTLQARSAPLYEESFLSAQADAASTIAHHTMRLGEREADVAPGETLLEAGLAAGLEMPFSCAVGGCAACRVRLVTGGAEMDEPNCLTAEERKQGYILACCSRPTSDCEIELS
ncbi:MAG: iron-sulfur cluster-binding domain-containing protein [Myxococcota bacterium]